MTGCIDPFSIDLWSIGVYEVAAVIFEALLGAPWPLIAAKDQ